MPETTKRRPWFALALAPYPLLHIAAANPGQVDAGTLGLVLAVAVVTCGLLLVFLRVALGNWLTAGLGVAWFSILFFSYGPLNAALGQPDADPDGAQLAPSWIEEHLHLLQSAIWLLLLALGWIRLRRLGSRPNRLAATLNFVSVLLLGFVLFQWFNGRERQAGPSNHAALQAAHALDAPDIYFIVLDGYARADMLAEHYGFDNGPFIRGLERRGFQVADASESNYTWTFLSLASTLNMDYLPGLLGDKLDVAGTDREHTYRLLRDNRAAGFLQARGYRYVHLQSTWGGTGSNPYADDFRACGSGLFRDDYLLAIAEVSWLRVFGTRASIDLASCHLTNLETLAGLGRERGPKFVVAHFLPPHHPYLFDREGRVLRNANLSNQFEFQKQLWEDRAAYVDQLVFMSSRIERAIDRLIAESDRPPVILLLSDHGPNLRRGFSSAQHYRIRLANLSAVRLPGAPGDLLPEDISNVNLLRIVFNRQFDADLARLPDRHFISPFLRPFDFTEVGEADLPVESAGRSADNM
jgi:hypothetical protein